MNLISNLIALALLAITGFYAEVVAPVEYDPIKKNPPQYASNKTAYLNFDAFYFQNPYARPLSSIPKCPAVNEYINCENHKRYRTADGTCNNLKYKWWGARHTPYQRLLAPDYHGEDSPRTVTSTFDGLPNARLLANLIPTYHKNSGLNSYFNYFAYFVGTDMGHTTKSKVNCSSCSHDSECFNIYLKPANEAPLSYYGQCDLDVSPMLAPTPARKKREIGYSECAITSQDCLPLIRSDDISNVMDCYFKDREQYSQGTHFTDLDPIYGSTQEQQINVRAYTSGLLKADKVPGSEPLESLSILNINECIQNDTATSGCFLSGDDRVDQNVFLTSMHTVFLRLHNYIARELKEKNAHWNDETIFQEARRISIALYQNIIYSEFLQILLGQGTMREFGLNTLQSGWSWNYDDYLYPNNFNEFVTAAFRLHNLVDKELHTSDLSSNLRLDDGFYNPSLTYYDINGVLRGMDTTPSHTSKFHMNSYLNHKLIDLTQSPTRTSLGAINIQRGRDHGLRRYIEYRKLAGNDCPMDWSELNNFQYACINKLESNQAYLSVKDIDLWLGLICEKPENDFLLAQTQRWIVGKNFYHNKYGDRLFFENGHDKVNRFTEAQLEVIRNFKFSNLMCIALDPAGDLGEDAPTFFEKFSTEDRKKRSPSEGESEGESEGVGEGNELINDPEILCRDLPKLDLDQWRDLKLTQNIYQETYVKKN